MYSSVGSLALELLYCMYLVTTASLALGHQTSGLLHTSSYPGYRQAEKIVVEKFILLSAD